MITPQIKEKNHKHILHDIVTQGCGQNWTVGTQREIEVVRDVLFLGMIVQRVGDHCITRVSKRFKMEKCISSFRLLLCIFFWVYSILKLSLLPYFGDIRETFSILHTETITAMMGERLRNHSGRRQETESLRFQVELTARQRCKLTHELDNWLWMKMSTRRQPITALSGKVGNASETPVPWQ